MTSRQKKLLLIFLGLVCVLIMIISTGLTSLELKPGMPLPIFANGEIFTPPAEGEDPMMFPLLDLFKKIFGIIFGCFFAYILYKAMRGIPWRDMAPTFLTGFITITVIGFVFLLIIILLPRDQTVGVPAIPTPRPELEAELSSVAEPSSLLWFVGIILFGSAVLAGYWIINSFTYKKDTIDLVHTEAEKAYLDILSGKDIRDVILHCYIQMGKALAHERGIERKSFMTTGEFEMLLQKEGIPYDPIHRLTQLFDIVRYGHAQPGPQDEQSAIDSLQKIMNYCAELKKAT